MFDLAVIGGGPAGYSAALEGTRLGLRVVLFEKEQLGGTCLNRGCVPTKFLAHVGQTLAQTELAARDGISISGAALNYHRTMERKAEILSSLREGLTQRMLQQKIKIVDGEASIQDERHVVCAGNIFAVQNILIATGSIPVAPLVPGTISSDELLELKERPKALHVLGGGVIAVEFASIFRNLGSKVTLSIRGDRILRKWEKEIAVGLTQSMKRQGIKIEANCSFQDLKIEKGAVLLSAVGRRPNLAGIDPRWFEVGANGGIIADFSGQTKTAGIFAAGDVLAGSPQLAHVGMEQGKRVARRIAGAPVEEKPVVVVSCVFAGQEAASAGMTEKEAKEQGVEAVAVKRPMYSNARTMISTTQRGFIKLVGDKETGKLIGAQLLCQRAGDIIAELSLAINQKLTPWELMNSIRPHPSYCEAVTEAAELLAERLA